MNLRTCASLVATAALMVAFPVAAQADPVDSQPTPSYQAREYCRISANPSSLQAGGTTQISLKDAPNTDVELNVTSVDTSVANGAITIRGKQTAVKKSDANGNASFSVTLAEPGDYELDASMSTGGFCGLTVTVASKDKAVDAAEDDESSAGANTAVLAATGATTLPYVGAAVVLVGAGAVVVAASRRRRNS